MSTLLIRHDLDASLQPAVATALIALAVAVIGAMLLAQLLLRPIHVIRSGLTRLGRGEFGVRLDLNQSDEFGELGTFFNRVSEQLSADRSQMAGQVANLESAVEHLEDAVAIVNPNGEFLFANPALRALLPNAAAGRALSDVVAAGHAIRHLFEQTLASRQSRGPLPATFSDDEKKDGEAAAAGERLILTHPVHDAQGALVGIMLIVAESGIPQPGAVDGPLFTQARGAWPPVGGRRARGEESAERDDDPSRAPASAVRRTQREPRRRVGRRAPSSRPIRRRLTRPRPCSTWTRSLDEIRRLDEVVQGFLKFTRPEDLKLQPVHLGALFDEVIPIVQPEAEARHVRFVVECNGAPDVNGDPAMLRQAFLNLALNACQAMPDGGTLTIRCEAARGRLVSITVADSGVGIKPEHLQRIFDLYFTTKPKGSGIGLSMVYRTVQMHDGEIEVQSTLGAGTTFRMLLPQA